MQAGKLPADLLASLLSSIQSRDPRVLVGPGIGRDAAVIDTGAPNLLVAKTDPITFAADRIGWYAVHINANDIACLGARPSWFLATVLLPEGAEPSLARSIVRQVSQACASLGIELVGGHTEITHGLTRPIVSGAMLGEVERDRLIEPGGAQPGDALILTKGIAIEGSSVLAREAGEELGRLGLSTSTLASARRMLHNPGISVVPESQAVCATVAVHAMHDPTEGGLATALSEMATACRLGIVVREDEINVLPVTRKICAAANLNPLGMLASGALLIAVAPADSRPAIDAIGTVGISAAIIGRFVQKRGVIMEATNRRRPVPRFERDEVARFLSARG